LVFLSEILPEIVPVWENELIEIKIAIKKQNVLTSKNLNMGILYKLLQKYG
jgi:hypothetical protein